jgi:hypothetical protein
VNPYVPLKSKAEGQSLRIVIPGRISKPTQDPDSISSQHEGVDSWVNRHAPEPRTVRHFGEQASDWCVHGEPKSPPSKIAAHLHRLEKDPNPRREEENKEHRPRHQRLH